MEYEDAWGDEEAMGVIAAVALASTIVTVGAIVFMSAAAWHAISYGAEAVRMVRRIR